MHLVVVLGTCFKEALDMALTCGCDHFSSETETQSQGLDEELAPFFVVKCWAGVGAGFQPEGFLKRFMTWICDGFDRQGDPTEVDQFIPLLGTSDVDILLCMVLLWFVSPT